MKVKLARTAGFCMGVRRAVNLTLDAARDKPLPIYTLGPLIHNPQVVEMLEKRGVAAAGEIPDSGAVVIRSHGVHPGAKKLLKERGLQVFDATCPRVARVHGIARGRHKSGFMVVVLGDPGHAEVEGIVGCAGGEAIVIKGPEGVESLPEADKVCLVAQTTQDRERFNRTAQAIRERYSDLPEGDLVIADTICDSTRNRQEEIRRLAKEVEAVVVVGGRDSANTRRLTEVAAGEGVPAFQVETEAELDPSELSRFKTVGLTAGASTPNWMIRRVYERLQEITPRKGPLDHLASAVKWTIMSNVYVALGGGALTIAAAALQGFLADPREILASMLFIFAAHTMTLIADDRALALNVPRRAESFTRFRGRWMAASVAAAILAVALYFTVGLVPGLAVAALAVASFLYPVRLIRGRRLNLPIRSLAEVPASKDLFMALGWSFLVVLMPLLARPGVHLRQPSALTAFLMVGGLAFVRALLRDFRDIQADRLIGRETLPIVLGTGKTRMILYASLVMLAALLAASTLTGWVASPLGYAMIVPLAYAAGCVPLFTRQTIVQGFGAELVIDLTFIIAGAVAALFSGLRLGP